MGVKIVDTNILLDSSLETVAKSFILTEKEVEIVIPFVVLEELDRFKNGNELINLNCRSTIRFLGNLIQESKEKITEGIHYGSAIIRVHVDPNQELNTNKVDNAIIALAKEIDGATIITKDIHERVLAEVNGVDAQLSCNAIDLNTLYTGIADMNITDKQVQELYEKDSFTTKKKFYTNEFVRMKDSNGSLSYGIYQHDRIELVKENNVIGRIKAKKDKVGEPIIEQRMLIRMLMDTSIKLMTVIGPAGSGKTFLTLAAGLDQTINNNVYDSILITRSLASVDRNIGALPGSKHEKLAPWMGSIFDNLDIILGINRYEDLGLIPPYKQAEELIDLGRIELEALDYVRGRSLTNKYIIIEDSQNLSVDHIVTILTRVSEGSKIIFLGDINKHQIDNKALTPCTNGLTYLVDRLKGSSDIYGHITLSHTVRSEVAELGVLIGEMDH